MKAHVLAQKINSILIDNKFDRFVGGKTRGKLDFSALSKIGYSPKVFKKREARKNKDYSVIVLADASGSMRGSPAHNTAQSLVMLNDALSKTDTKFAIWSFNGEILSLKDFAEDKKSKEIHDLYRHALEERGLFKCFACRTVYGTRDRYHRTEERCSLCHSTRFGITSSSGYNADGLALHMAYEAVKTQTGNHIIVILSDGEADCVPDDCDYHYMTSDGIKYSQMPIKKVAQKCVDDGVILCSIGIESSAVSRIYPKQNTIVVDDSEQVGEALVKLITKNIKRG